MYNLQIKSIDVMKKTKDLFENQITTEEKTDLIQCLKTTGATHIAISIIADDNTVLRGVNNHPSPRTIEDETKDWCDVIHNAGLNVMHRPPFGSEEASNFTNFSEDTGNSIGTASSLFVFTDSFSTLNLLYYTENGNWTDTAGYLVAPSANGWNNTLVTTTSFTDFTAQAKVQIPAGPGNTQLIFRSSNSAGYGIQLRGVDQVIRLEDWGRTNIAQASKSISAGQIWQIKVTVSGTSIKAKAWIDGQNEPGTWDINVTDSTYASGGVGFSSESSGAIYYNLTVTPFVDNSTWAGKYYRYLNYHVGSHVKSGDIFAPYPEGDDFIINHSWLSTGNAQTNFFNLLTQSHLITSNYASTYGVNLTFMTHMNFSQIASGWAGLSVFTDQNIVAADYYGQIRGTINNQPSDYVYDWQKIASGISPNGGYAIPAGGYSQFQSEFGDLPNAMPSSVITPEDRYSFLINFYKGYRDNLISPNGKMIGFNYWGGWEGQNTSILYKDSNGKYQLNARGKILQSFYKSSRGTNRIPVITAGTDISSYTY